MENMTTDYQGFKRDTDLAVEKIRTGAMTMAQGAVELGYQLKVARDTGVLQESGYSSMGEFAPCRIWTPPGSDDAIHTAQ